MKCKFVKMGGQGGRRWQADHCFFKGKAKTQKQGELGAGAIFAREAILVE